MRRPTMVGNECRDPKTFLLELLDDAKTDVLAIQCRLSLSGAIELPGFGERTVGILSNTVLLAHGLMGRDRRVFEIVNQLLGGKDSEAAKDSPILRSYGVEDDFAQGIRSLNNDPYLYVADEALKLLSVFDDLKYDRADLDIVSTPMRYRVLSKLKPLGFRQTSGSIFENASLDVRMHIPKFRALGASPFDAARDTHRRPQDFFVLTPTQTACELITNYSTSEAKEKICALIQRHPINILRIFDYLEKSPRHKAFSESIGHLKFLQRRAITSEPLRSRRALR